MCLLGLVLDQGEYDAEAVYDVNHEDGVLQAEDDQAPAGDDVVRVLTFEDGQGLNRMEKLIQDRVPRKHDRNSFYDKDVACWCPVKLTSNPKKKRRWKYFYHYIDANRQTEGGFTLFLMTVGLLWKYLMIMS